MLDKSKPIIKWSTVKNRVGAIRQLVHTFCIFYFQEVTSRELDLLCEIVNYGEVTKEVKDSFQINYKLSKENTSTILTRLTEKGILVPKLHKTGKELNSKFKELIKVTNGELNNIILLNYDAKTG